MLFRKKIERACSYCVYSAKLDDGACLCSKRGLKSELDSCRKFRYDPANGCHLKQRQWTFLSSRTATFPWMDRQNANSRSRLVL